MKQARKADGKNGQEIIDFFEKINYKCNRLRWTSGQINARSALYFYIDYENDLRCDTKLPSGYELITKHPSDVVLGDGSSLTKNMEIEPSKESKLDLKTLQFVQFMFGLHSDSSTRTNGYNSLCHLIEKTQKRIKPSGESEFDKAFLKLKITNLLLSATGFGNYGKPLSDIEVTEKLIEIAEAYSTQQNKELKEEIERLKECLKEAISTIELAINGTPSGELRNKLTDFNISIQAKQLIK